MSLPDVDLMLKLLETKKQQLAANSVLTQKQLLKVLLLAFVFFFKFSCLLGISATFEETKRRTAFCIAEGGRCDSGKPLVHFLFSHFPQLHLPGGPGFCGLGAAAAREEARRKVCIL